jgi:hypothetical protein
VIDAGRIRRRRARDWPIWRRIPRPRNGIPPPTERTIGRFFLLAITITIVAAGCAEKDQIVEPKPPSFGQPLVEPLPLRIDYVFDPSVDREVLTTDRGDQRYHLRLGPATRITFGRVFAASFVDAVELPAEKLAQNPPAGSGGIIQVRLAAAEIVNYAAWVKFELIFLSAGGSQDGVWRVPGYSPAADSEQQSMERAIRAAAAETVRGLGRQPAVLSWLERRDRGHVDPSRNNQ